MSDRRIAIVTGASSGIGICISRMLCKKGFMVYGIGRNFSEKINDRLFIPIICDITDISELENIVKKIEYREDISVLVNNAGMAYYGLHEELNKDKISRMVRTNIEAPMILTQLLLRTLKKNKGFVINISSVTASKSSPHGCAYAATKAGLSSFSQSLFDEVRKYGVKVVSIQPDMTKTNLYRNADFCQDDDNEAYIEPEEIADAVEYIINRRDGLVITEMTIQPQKHRIKKKGI